MTRTQLRRIALSLAAALAVAVVVMDYANPGGSVRLYLQALKHGWHSPTPTCPSCDTDAALRRHILAAIPELAEKLEHDRLAAALALRDWTASTIDRGMHGSAELFTQMSVTHDMTAGRLFRLLDDDISATQCGGAAAFFRLVLGLFGFDAVDYSIGIPGETSSHVTNLVAVRKAGSLRFYPMDPWYAMHFSGLDGEPLDLDTLARLTADGRRDAYAPSLAGLSPRTFVLTLADLSKEPTGYSSEGIGASACRPFRSLGRLAYSCRENVASSFDFAFSPARLGRMEATAGIVYARMLIHEVFAMHGQVSPEGKAALCPMLNRIGVCSNSARPCRPLCADAQ